MGNVYVADFGNYTVRKVTAEGTVTTFAGSPGQSGTNDGPSSVARFLAPYRVTVDSTGNVFVLDSGNLLTTGNLIRKITPSGIVSTVAHLVGIGNTDGTGSAARFFRPEGIAVDSAGNLYVADDINNNIRVGTTNTCADQPIIDRTSAPVGQPRQLDTSPQTAVAWQWSLIRQPSASSAKLSATNVRNPTFTPDVADLYVFRLYATNAAGAICIRTLSLTAMLQPPRLSASQMQTNDQFSFTLLSPAGSTVEIQGSTNLLSWTILATLTNVTGTLPFTDSVGTFTQRFYRALQLP